MTVTDNLQTIVLTGATGSLGGALVSEFARRRPQQLILVGRSRSALANVADRARTAGARAVRVVEADLADLATVAVAGDRIRELAADAGAPVTSMVLNAGVQLADRRHRSAQGYESTFAINVASTHILLRTLLPAVAPGARAVLVSSGTHFGDWHSYGMVPRPEWRDPAELARPDIRSAPIVRGSGGRA